MPNIENEQILSDTFWTEEARSERVGAVLSFVIGTSCAFAAVAEVADPNIGSRIFSIPAAIFAWEAFKLGFNELREASNIERKSQTD